jgi:hypothetical protein
MPLGPGRRNRSGRLSYVVLKWEPTAAGGARVAVRMACEQGSRLVGVEMSVDELDSDGIYSEARLRERLEQQCQP